MLISPVNGYNHMVPIARTSLKNRGMIRSDNADNDNVDSRRARSVPQRLRPLESSSTELSASQLLHQPVAKSPPCTADSSSNPPHRMSPLPFDESASMTSNSLVLGSPERLSKSLPCLHLNSLKNGMNMRKGKKTNPGKMKWEIPSEQISTKASLNCEDTNVIAMDEDRSAVVRSVMDPGSIAASWTYLSTASRAALSRGR